MKFLVIQTAFIGDVILATPLIERLRQEYPDAIIDVALRKGNESLLAGHPYVRKVFVWRKKEEKYRGLWRLAREMRREQYDWAINCQRFAASGIMTLLSGARHTAGFDKNPLSWLFSRRVAHRFGTAAQPVHEVERNLLLIAHLCRDKSLQPPRLYPSEQDYTDARRVQPAAGAYVTIAPTSVWFTKQYPAHKWVELIRRFSPATTVFLLGGPSDTAACEAIRAAVPEHAVVNLCGQLSFLQSAALMAGAAMNYVNDSAPMHMASAVNAPVTAVFCSTVPAFGFTPLSQNADIVETTETLSCRPCGLHGYAACPKGHFKCAESIEATAFKIP